MIPSFFRTLFLTVSTFAPLVAGLSHRCDGEAGGRGRHATIDPPFMPRRLHSLLTLTCDKTTSDARHRINVSSVSLLKLHILRLDNELVIGRAASWRLHAFRSWSLDRDRGNPAEIGSQEWQTRVRAKGTSERLC